MVFVVVFFVIKCACVIIPVQKTKPNVSVFSFWRFRRWRRSWCWLGCGLLYFFWRFWCIVISRCVWFCWSFPFARWANWFGVVPWVFIWILILIRVFRSPSRVHSRSAISFRQPWVSLSSVLRPFRWKLIFKLLLGSTRSVLPTTCL